MDYFNNKLITYHDKIFIKTFDFMKDNHFSEIKDTEIMQNRNNLLRKLHTKILIGNKAVHKIAIFPITNSLRIKFF